MPAAPRPSMAKCMSREGLSCAPLIPYLRFCHPRVLLNRLWAHVQASGAGGLELVGAFFSLPAWDRVLEQSPFIEGVR